MGDKKESHFARVAEREEAKRGEEVKITEEMEEVFAKAGIWAVATATEEGIPNVVPMAFVKVLSKNQLMLVDNFLMKTRTNLLTNPNIAVSVWDAETNKGYQFKGKARFETSGEIFDAGVEIVRQKSDKLVAKAAVVINVAEIFVTTPGPDAGKRVSGAAGW